MPRNSSPIIHAYTPQYFPDSMMRRTPPKGGIPWLLVKKLTCQFPDFGLSNTSRKRPVLPSRALYTPVAIGLTARRPLRLEFPLLAPPTVFRDGWYPLTQAAPSPSHPLQQEDPS